MNVLFQSLSKSSLMHGDAVQFTVYVNVDCRGVALLASFERQIQSVARKSYVQRSLSQCIFQKIQSQRWNQRVNGSSDSHVLNMYSLAEVLNFNYLMENLLFHKSFVGTPYNLNMSMLLINSK